LGLAVKYFAQAGLHLGAKDHFVVSKRSELLNSSEKIKFHFAVSIEPKERDGAKCSWNRFILLFSAAVRQGKLQIKQIKMKSAVFIKSSYGLKELWFAGC
jgi:hypothetical protein